MRIKTQLVAVISALAFFSMFSFLFFRYEAAGMYRERAVLEYAGRLLVEVQRLVALEAAGRPSEKLVSAIDGMALSLRDGSGELGLPRASGDFLKAMEAAGAAWNELKREIAIHRSDPSIIEGMIEASEDFYSHAGEAIGYARGLSGKRHAFLRAVQVISLFSCIALLAGLWFLVRLKVTEPIEHFTEMTATIGSGDLSVKMDFEDDDEVGRLARGFNAAVANIRETVRNVARATEVIASSSEQLSATTHNLTEGARSQSSQTEQTATAMAQMSQTIIDVASNAGEVAEASRDTSKLALDGRQKVVQTVDGMRRIADSVKLSADTIGELGSSSKQIGNIVSTINEIADQTNLLALNAAIEAARAGDQGRGFAVVADEVRKLAERTGKATGEIGDMINKIQADTKKAVQSMESGKGEVDSGVGLAEEAMAALDKIVQSSDRSAAMVQRIATAAEEQSSAVEEVSATVDSIAMVTRRTEGASVQIQVSAQDLARVASELKSHTDWFKIEQG